jgi:hypothetical protein
LVLLPWVASWALLYFAATPITKGLLAKFVNAPSGVEKVEVNWLLNDYKILNLFIDNPSGFPKGKLLSIRETDIHIGTKSFYTFKPYANIRLSGFYFHYIRNSNNATNVAVAFGVSYQPAKVSPMEFEIHNTNATIDIKTLSDVEYHAKGYFKGFHNDALFVIDGKGDLSDPENPKTHTEFKVYDWQIKDNKYLNQLAVLLGKPELKEITLSKIVGSVDIRGGWVIFGDTKAYTVNALFAEIYKGSKYNRITKELDIKGKLYYPITVEFKITGTTEHPKVELINFNPLKVINKLQQLQQVPSKLLPSSVQNATENPSEFVNKLKERAKEELEKLKEKLQEQLPIKLP